MCQSSYNGLPAGTGEGFEGHCGEINSWGHAASRMDPGCGLTSLRTKMRPCWQALHSQLQKRNWVLLHLPYSTKQNKRIKIPSQYYEANLL